MKTQRYTLRRVWPVPEDMDLMEAAAEALGEFEAEVGEHTDQGFRLLEGPFVDATGTEIICAAKMRGPVGKAWAEEGEGTP